MTTGAHVDRVLQAARDEGRLSCDALRALEAMAPYADAQGYFMFREEDGSLTPSRLAIPNRQQRRARNRRNRG